MIFRECPSKNIMKLRYTCLIVNSAKVRAAALSTSGTARIVVAKAQSTTTREKYIDEYKEGSLRRELINSKKDFRAVSQRLDCVVL